MRAASVAAALALALTSVACALGSSNLDGPGTDGGSGTGGMSGPPQCQVNIAVIDSPADGGLAAGANATLRVRGTETLAPGASYTWRWNVTFADGSAVSVTQVGSDMRLVDFPLARAGTYTVDVQLIGGGASCAGELPVVVPAAGARLASFRFRFVPASASLPAQDQVIQVAGGTPYRGSAVFLSAGSIVRFDARDQAAGAAVPSYLRITDSATGRVAVEAHTPSAGGSIDVRLVEGTYDMLVVPDGDVAPMLITGQTPAALQAAMPLALPIGAAVSGHVKDGATPIAGAKITLRAGTLPSTLATTDSAGHFTLHAATGTFGATITQASGQGVLEATLPPASGVTIDPSATAAPPSLEIAMHAPPATGTVKLHVTAAQAASLAVGSTVVFESAAPLLGVATVSVSGGVARAASVRFRSELAPRPDSGGASAASVSIAGMPVARYRATVFPAIADGPDAITATELDLSGGAAPPGTTELALAPKVSLAGTLTPTAETSGVLVTAVDVAGDFPIAIAAPSTAGGLFNLSVSPGRMYRLRAQPAIGQPLARVLFGPVAVGAVSVTLAPETMQSALYYARTVVDGALAGVGGALVQVFCLATSPGCTDVETPIAEAITRSDGFFELMLPDPGVDP